MLILLLEKLRYQKKKVRNFTPNNFCTNTFQIYGPETNAPCVKISWALQTSETAVKYVLYLNALNKALILNVYYLNSIQND